MTCVLQGAQAPTGFNGLGSGVPTVPTFNKQYGNTVYSSGQGGDYRGQLHKDDRHDEYLHQVPLSQCIREKYVNIGPGLSQPAVLSMPWLASSSVQSSFAVQSSIVPNLASPAFYSRQMHTPFHGQGQVPCVSTRCTALGRVDTVASTQRPALSSVDTRVSTERPALNSVDSRVSTQCNALRYVDTTQFVHPSICSTRGRNTEWSYHGRQVKQHKYGFAPVVRNSGRDIASLTTPLSVDCSVEYEMPSLPSIPPDSAPILQIMSRSDADTKGSCHKSAPPDTHGSKLPDLTRLGAPVPPSQLTKPPIYNWTQSYQNTMAIKTPYHNTMATRTPCQHDTMIIKTPCQHQIMRTRVPCLHDTMGIRTPCLQDTMGSRTPCQKSSHRVPMGVQISSHPSMMGTMYHNATIIRTPSFQETYCDSMNVRTSSQLRKPSHLDSAGSRTFSHPAVMRTKPDISNLGTIGTGPGISTCGQIGTGHDISHSGRIGIRPETYYPIIMGATPEISHPSTRSSMSHHHPATIGTLPRISLPATTGTQPDISHPTTILTLPDMPHPATIGTLPNMSHPATIGTLSDMSHAGTIETQPGMSHPATLGTLSNMFHSSTMKARPDICHPNIALTVDCIPVAVSPETDSLQHVMDGVRKTGHFQPVRQPAGNTQGDRPNKRKLTTELCMEQCARPIYLETKRKQKDSDRLQRVQSAQCGSVKRQRLSYPGMADINQAFVWPHNAYYNNNNNSSSVNNCNSGYMMDHTDMLSRGFYRDIRYGFHSF